MTLDFWGAPFDGAKHPDVPEPADFRHEAEPIELDRFDPAEEAAPVWRAPYVNGDDL